MTSDSFHKVLHNRLVNTLCDIYVLPDDDEEDVRLRSETTVLDRVLGPVYQKVDQWLKKPDVSCLDLGSARGDWIDQMAARNPGAEFTGIDLVPSRRPPTALGPPTATFQIRDINAGLESFHGMYDVVHARNLTQGIQRWSSFIVDAADTLVSGGLALFIEWDYQIYNASKIPYKPTSPTYEPNQRAPTFQVPRSATPQVPALTHFLSSVIRASSNAGSHITAVHHLAAFVERSHQFKDIETRDIWIPVIPAPGADAQERKTATEFRTAFVGFLGSCTPLLLSHGNYTTTELSMLEDAARIEVMGGKVPIYVRFMAVTAVKK